MTSPTPSKIREEFDKARDLYIYKYIKKYHTNPPSYDAFLEGAKWMAERLALESKQLWADDYQVLNSDKIHEITKELGT